MTGVETAAVALGAAVVRSAVKLWLGDRAIAADVTAKAIDLLSGRMTSALEQRRTRRVFEQLEEVLAERLEPLLAYEYGQLDDAERTAAVDAVRRTFDEAALTDEDLFAFDLDAGYLDRYLRRAVPDILSRYALNEAGRAFYDRLLRECCACLVQLTTTLPTFQRGALTELLRRESEVLERTRTVLARLPERRSVDDFETDYRGQVVTALDRMRFYGVSVAEQSRRYSLSVAYVDLTVSTDEFAGPPPNDPNFAEPTDSGATMFQADELLGRTSRLLIRGEAGSGKTTLLQWIAVRSATDGRVPFFLRLRHYVTEQLPTPERFLAEIGRHIADEMPPGWVQRELRGGHAIVLIDGVDELPHERRRDVHTWLRELVDAFPAAHYVLTTRPAAIEPDWLGDLGFAIADLQPMTPTDIRGFVARWHEAMRLQSADQDEREDLERYERELVDAIIARPPLRRIAQSPLLCALMCALYRDRHGQLPDDRMELYEVTLQVMLERRDLERGIAPPTGLSRTEKSLILRDIAYWLVRNGRSDADRVRVRERIAAMLVAMPQVRATVDEVFRHLLERSGLLREPIAGQVDFVHRTFQEYLAAKAAVDADDIGILVEHAHLDQWWEVIIMAAGHASRRQREELLTALVEEQIDNRRQRDWRDLLALACLETSPQLDVDLRARIESRAGRLLPPRSMEVADSLASGGEFVLDLLARSHPRSAHEVAATVRAAARIGGDSALRLLIRFSRDARPPVVEELVDAWSHFDPVEYAETILRQLPWPEGNLNISDPALVAGLPALKSLRELDCRFPTGLGDLGFVRELPNLRTLALSDPARADLTALAGSQLETLRIVRLGTAPVNLAELVGATRLRRLNVHVPSVHWGRLAELPVLNRLQLAAPPGVDELADLAPMSRLTRLIVEDLSDRFDLTDLEFLAKPDTLGLINWADLVDLHGVERWADSLVNLWLRDCPFVHIDQLAHLQNLTTVDLSGTQVTDLTVLASLRRLRRVRLMRMPELSLAPLRDLPELTSLYLQDSGDVDLSPLAGKESLTIYVTRRQTTTGAEWLGEGSKLERI